MTENLLIRALAQEDAARISAAFAAQGWDKPVAQYLRYWQEQNDGARAVFVAECAEEFAGYITVVWLSEYPPFLLENIPEIVDLNVLKRFQRRGIAGALLDAAEKLAGERSPVVGLGVGLMADYGPAQRMYVKRGYLPDGRGVWSHGEPLLYGENVQVDDNLAIYLTRPL